MQKIQNIPEVCESSLEGHITKLGKNGMSIALLNEIA